MKEKITVKGVFNKITDYKTIKWILQSSKPQMFSIVFLTVLNVILAYISIVISYMLRFVINSATGVYGETVDERIEGIAFWGVLFAVTILVQIGMSILSNHLVFRIQARLNIILRSRLYHKMLRKDYSQISAFHSGELVNRLNNDVSTISSSITQLIPGVVYTFSKLIGIFVVLLSIDAVFTVLFLLVGIGVFLFSLLFKGMMKSYHKQIMDTDGKIRSFMQETLASLIVVKVFKVEKKVEKTADELQEINYGRKRKRNLITLSTQGLFSLAFNGAYLFGLFYCAVKIAYGDPSVDIGTLSQVLSLVSQISTPISSLAAIVPVFYNAVGSAERLMEIENLSDEQIINEKKINVKNVYSKLASIEFDNITFSYDREQIFENTSLTVDKEDLVVMTGISGIGKSTLTKLLLGVFPLDGGEIYLKLQDGTKIPVDKNIRRFFSYVPQGNFLLSGTIRDNISFIKSDATEDEIKKAVEFACADFIFDLPQGLDTMIGEKGSGLSEGQIQRVAIARAFLSDAPVVLLDEATSALDEATELRLLSNIKKLSNKTCILVSHKKAANTICNKEVRIIDKKITVIDNNEESESGN